VIHNLGIGNKIKDIRLKLGKNVREFAEIIGLFSPDYLSKIERGDIKEPKYEYLIAISRYTGVSIDFILTGRNYSKETIPIPIEGYDKKLVFKVLKDLEEKMEELRTDLNTFKKLKSDLETAHKSKNKVA